MKLDLPGYVSMEVERAQSRLPYAKYPTLLDEISLTVADEGVMSVRLTPKQAKQLARELLSLATQIESTATRSV
jgi:hypothetical protein